MKFFQISFLAVALLTTASQAKIRVGGSDLLAPHLETTLMERIQELGLEVEIDFAGSYQGVEKLKSGDLDLSIVAIPVGETLPEEDFRVVPFASLVVTVAVSPANPITQMTFQQLGGVFGQAQSISLSRWGDAGLTGEWTARSIAPGAVTPVKHGLALDLFRHTVMQAGALRRTLTYFEDLDAVRERLARDNAAIVLLHRIPEVTEGLKLLAISEGTDQRAIAPRLETVAAGDYPLRLPLYIMYRSDKGEELRELLRFLVDDEGTEAVEKSGLAPLPEMARERLSLDFERL